MRRSNKAKSLFPGIDMSFDDRANRLVSVSDEYRERADASENKARDYILHKYGQLGIILASYVWEDLPKSKRDWPDFVREVVTPYLEAHGKSLPEASDDEGFDDEEEYEEEIEGEGVTYRSAQSLLEDDSY